ncbi:WD40 repeat-like protein [Marasmius fiardii PR-910]|nr:WD40 repeat-like protein [Marasmius fiardii PR-910]
MDRTKRPVSSITRRDSRPSERCSPHSTSEEFTSEGVEQLPSQDTVGVPVITRANSQNPKLAAAISMLQLVHTIVDDISVPGLKAAIGSLLLFLNMCRKYKENAVTISNFIRSIEQLEERLKRFRNREFTDPSIQQQLISLSKEIEEIYKPQIEALNSPQFEFSFKSIYARLARIFYSGEYEKLLVALTATIGESTRNIQDDVNLETNVAMKDTSEKVNRMWVDSLLKPLHIAKKALHDSGDRRICLKNTRTHLQKEINKWSRSNTSPQVLWLQGLQGTGKSTIACSVAKSSEDFRYMGTFFGTPEYDVTQVVSTLAYQIANRAPEFRAHFKMNIQNSIDIGTKSIPEQFEKLLLGPLRAQFSYQASPVILIIDGLDECCRREEHGMDKLKIFLDALIDCVKEISSMKVFISCGSVSQLKVVSTDNATIFRTVCLEEDKSVRDDIRRFVKHETPPQYRDDNEVSLALDRVVNKADGSFLYASYMLSLLSDDRKDFLTQVDADGLKGAEAVIAGYERLVAKALKREPDEGSRGHLRSALVAIAGHLLEPLSVQSTSELFKIEPSTRLLSFLNEISTHIQPKTFTLGSRIHFSHTLFNEFLRRQSSSASSPGATIAVHHYKITIYLFQYMRLNLRRNACGLLADWRRENAFDKPESFHKEGLKYACQRWADHLHEGVAHNNDVSDSTLKSTFEELHEFVYDPYLVLNWLEVLCLLKDVRRAIDALEKASKWVSSESFPEHRDVYERLKSIQAAVRTCNAVLDDYPLQVYETLLVPFTSETQKLAKIYSHIKTRVDSIYLRSYRRTIETGMDVDFISFSLDGRLVATANTNGSLKLWDIHANSLLDERPISREGSSVSLHDMQFIGCDKIATVHFDQQGKYVEINTRNYSQPSITPLLHVSVDDITQNPLRIITSLDRKYIAIALQGIVHFWKTELHEDAINRPICGSRVLAVGSRKFLSNHALQSVKDGRALVNFPHPITYGAFNSDESVFAVGVDDGQIYLYDGQPPEQRAKLFCGTPIPSTSLLFSPSGTHLVALGLSYVGIWSISTPERNRNITQLKLSSSCFGFGFSQNGKFYNIASLTGCGKMVIESYRVDTPPSSQVVTAAAYSHSGELIATGCADGRIAVYRVSDNPPWENCVYSWPGSQCRKAGKIVHVVFSPDGRFLASTSVVTMLRAIPPSEPDIMVNEVVGHKRLLPLSAFSGDSRYLASAHENNNKLYIEMFDIETRALSYTLGFPVDFWRGGDIGTEIRSLALSKDGSKCTLASTDFLALYSCKDRSVGTGDVLQVRQGHVSLIKVSDARSLRFSDDGCYITSTAGVFEVTSGLSKAADGVDSERCLVRDGWIVDRFGKKCCFLPYNKYDFWDSHGSQLMLCVGGGSIVFVRVSDRMVDTRCTT